MKADLSPAGRALRAPELLQDQPGITGGQLAAQLGVTERAARRYIAILREAGIPVESTRGPYGGYRAGRGIRLPPLVFTATEALGLVMAVPDGSHPAADAGDPVGAALGKIIRVLPGNVARQAAVVRRHACAAPGRGAVRPGTEATSALVDAIAARRRVSIGYRSQSVAGGGEQFRAPADLDYVDLLEQYLGAGWEFQTKVVFDAPCDEVARYVRPPMGRLNRTDGGARCVLTGTTSNPAMYAGEWLAAIPVTFHVQGGPELRAAVADVTARLTAALEPCRSHPGRSRTSAEARRRVSFSFEPGHSRPG